MQKQQPDWVEKLEKDLTKPQEKPKMARSKPVNLHTRTLWTKHSTDTYAGK